MKNSKENTKKQICLFVFGCPNNSQLIFSLSLHLVVYFSAGTLQQLISDTMVRWAQESVIEAPELVRAMFVLLHRQYDGIGGQVCLSVFIEKTYHCEPAVVKYG